MRGLQRRCMALGTGTHTATYGNTARRRQPRRTCVPPVHRVVVHLHVAAGGGRREAGCVDHIHPSALPHGPAPRPPPALKQAPPQAGPTPHLHDKERGVGDDASQGAAVERGEAPGALQHVLALVQRLDGLAGEGRVWGRVRGGAVVYERWAGGTGSREQGAGGPACKAPCKAHEQEYRAHTSCELSRLVGTVPSSAADCCRSVAELAAAAAAAAFRRAGTLAAAQQSARRLCGAARGALQLLLQLAAVAWRLAAIDEAASVAAMSECCKGMLPVDLLLHACARKARPVLQLVQVHIRQQKEQGFRLCCNCAVP